MKTLKLYKTIFQVRYKAELKFYELLFPAARKLTGYPDWETNKLRIILKNFDNHCNLAINHNAITYEQDSDDVELETAYINRLVDILPKALNIDSFIRFGYRRRYLVAVDFPFESLVQMLNIKLLSQDSQLREIFPQRFTDLMYRVDSEDETYKYHFLVGPAEKQEIPLYIAFNQERNLRPENRSDAYNELIQNYPDVAIVIDVDLYQESEAMSLEELKAFVPTARGAVEGLASKLTKYLLFEKVEH